MSRSSEAAIQQDEQDNLSGMDDYQEWKYEQSMRAETLCDLADDKNKELKEVEE